MQIPESWSVSMNCGELLSLCRIAASVNDLVGDDRDQQLGQAERDLILRAVAVTGRTPEQAGVTL